MTKLTVGTIISWESPSGATNITTLRDALKASGFSEKLAKDMAPRCAFTRAIKELSDQRIIRRLEESEDEITFQFTKEYKQGGEFQYSTECQLKLNKDTGNVRSDDGPDIASHAEQLVRDHQSKRCSADITRLIQRIMLAEKGDLVPIRKQGGVYFVPDTHTRTVERIDKLLGLLGGNLGQFKINAGDTSTNQSVASNMTDHMLSLIDELKERCSTVHTNTGEATIIRRVEAINELRAKLKSYESLLAANATKIADELVNTEALLLRAVTQEASAA